MWMGLISTLSDVKSGEELFLRSAPTKYQRKIIFGSDESDADINGGTLDDRLYGMAGNEKLTGGDGNDI